MAKDWMRATHSSPTPTQTEPGPGRSVPLKPQVNFLQFTGFATRLRLVLAVAGMPVLISFVLLFLVPPDVAKANRLPLLLVVLVIVQFASAALLNPPLRRLRRASRSVASSVEGAGTGIASLRTWQEEQQKANMLVAAVLGGVLKNIEKVAATVQTHQGHLMEAYKAFSTLSDYEQLTGDPLLHNHALQVEARFRQLYQSSQALNELLVNKLAPDKLADAHAGARDVLNHLSTTAASLTATLAQLEHLNQAARELF